MPDLIVAGSITLDDIAAVSTVARSELGGSAIYCGLAASRFCRVGLISRVGTDFPTQPLFWLSQTIDTEGVTINGQTSHRKILKGSPDFSKPTGPITEPEKIPDYFRSAPFYLLADADPPSIKQLIAQLSPGPRVIAITNINQWFPTSRQSATRLLKRVTILSVTEQEIEQLTGTSLMKAARQVLAYGTQYVIIWRVCGSVIMVSQRGIFSVGGYPTELVVDQTGAQEAFTGALVGFVANQYQKMNTATINEPIIRKAIVSGMVTASFTQEGVGTELLQKISIDDIHARYEQMKYFQQF